MKRFSLVVIIGFLSFFGCAEHSPEHDKVTSANNTEFTSNFADTTNSTGSANGHEKSSDELLGIGKYAKITLTNCKELYNDNLIPIHWITITNKTDRVIKGISVEPGHDAENVMYKVVLGPHGSKRLKTDKFTCDSRVSGIVYSIGEYESIGFLGITGKVEESPDSYQK